MWAKITSKTVHKDKNGDCDTKPEKTPNEIRPVKNMKNIFKVF